MIFNFMKRTHLENSRRLYVNEQNAVVRAKNKYLSTPLTTILKLCERDHFASNLLLRCTTVLYMRFLKKKAWNRRKRKKKVAGEDIYETQLIRRVPGGSTRNVSQKSWIIHTDHIRISQIIHYSPIHTPPKPVVFHNLFIERVATLVLNKENFYRNSGIKVI